MRLRGMVLLLGWALVAAVPTTARAQACAEFSDVTVFDPFCTNIRWLKNRAITLGCTATEFCGNDRVSRLQMAAFMVRTANIVVPQVIDVEATGGAFDPATPQVLCQTAELAALDYNRTATAVADLSFDVAGQQALALYVATSGDGGATWQPVTNQIIPASVAGDAAARHTATLIASAPAHPFNSSDFYAGTPRRYGIYVARLSNLNTANVTGWTCHLQVFLGTTRE
jgi:hypothetical protein